MTHPTEKKYKTLCLHFEHFKIPMKIVTLSTSYQERLTEITSGISVHIFDIHWCKWWKLNTSDSLEVTLKIDVCLYGSHRWWLKWVIDLKIRLWFMIPELLRQMKCLVFIYWAILDIFHFEKSYNKINQKKLNFPIKNEIEI